jgi:acyl-CoA-binding protein
MPIDEEFRDATTQVANLRGLGNDQLLSLYGLFKQATQGDVTGSRPGMLDPKGRAKYDAWTGRKGLPRDDAKRQYVELARSLGGQLE